MVQYLDTASRTLTHTIVFDEGIIHLGLFNSICLDNDGLLVAKDYGTQFVKVDTKLGLVHESKDFKIRC